MKGVESRRRSRCLEINQGAARFFAHGQNGSFGALSRIRSLVRSRADLFDLAVSGPAAAGLVSTILFILGLSFSSSMPKVRPPLPCTPAVALFLTLCL